MDDWPTYTGGTASPPHDVQVVAWTERVDATRVDRWRAMLTPDELARAERFRFERHATAWTAARGGLREALGLALGRDPASLRFETTPRGKPSLVDASGLIFNLSHTEGMVMLVLARAGAVGVDAEALRPVPERDAIARTHFTSAERAWIGGAERRGQGDWAFMRLWTRKEAVIKAVGIGLGYPLTDVDVSLGTHGHAPAFADGAPGGAGSWWLGDLAVGDGHLAALACRFSPGEISRSRLR